MGLIDVPPRLQAIDEVSRLRLGMAQLGPAGLSEQWLLRHCGDLHWALIARALGQRRARFRAVDGRPVYAAFCTTSLRLATASPELLGEDAEIISTLAAVSDIRTGSRHSLQVGGAIALPSCR